MVESLGSNSKSTEDIYYEFLTESASAIAAIWEKTYGTKMDGFDQCILKVYLDDIFKYYEGLVVPPDMCI